MADVVKKNKDFFGKDVLLLFLNEVRCEQIKNKAGDRSLPQGSLQV